MMQAIFLFLAVIAACLGQYILRVRPPATELKFTGLYLLASLCFYGTSFAITAMVLPGVERRLAVLILSLQYPLLYLSFAMREGSALSPVNAIAITMGYALVAFGMSTTR